MTDRVPAPTSVGRGAPVRRGARERVRRVAVVGLSISVVAGIVLALPTPLVGPVHADDPAPVAPAPVAPAPVAPPSAVKGRAPTEKERADLIGALRPYLDADSPQGFNHRLALIEVVRRLKDAGYDALADVDGLRTSLYQARGFLPPYEKKPKDAGKDYEVRVDSASGVVSVKSDVRLAISAPATYVAARDQKKLSSYAPLPIIVVLHSSDDYEDKKAQKPWPGEEAIKRLYPKALMKAVTDAAFVFAPIWSKARFTEADAVQRDRVPLIAAWKHYQVDFNRIVIDGGSDALLFAAAYPTFYAGVIVRGDATDLPPDIVRNLSSTFVYVVQTGEAQAPAYKTLRAGGHPEAQLKSGPASGLVEWLGTVKRVTPKSFTWVVKDKSAHRLAQWINLDEIEEGGEPPTIEATILDTTEDPNTVRIRSTGVRKITIFLNDQLLDLDRDVRVVVNGKVVDECRIETNRPEGAVVRLPARFTRTVDGMFDRRSVSIRRSMFYGWLYPVALEQIAIAGDAPPPEVIDPEAPVGTSPKDQAEAAAKIYFDKAAEQEKAGHLPKAKALYEKACEVGATSLQEKARAKVEELETKLAPPPPEGPAMGGAALALHR